MEEMPSTTTPSTGTFSPGFSKILSPISMASTGISLSSPSLITVATSGVRSMRDRMAPEVLCLALASKNFPRSIKTTMVAADSK